MDVAKMTSVTYGAYGWRPAGVPIGMPKGLGILFGSVVLVSFKAIYTLQLTYNESFFHY
jgi:hypothetical protein